MLSLGLLVGAVTISRTIITFIIVLGLLVFAHEFGHYIMAKASGVRVEEFALGFGPKLIGFRKGETFYSLRILPLGGFCKMTGEFPNAEEELEGEELAAYQEAVASGRALYQKSIFSRFWVLFTGPLMNFVLAAILFSGIYAVVGLPEEASDQPIIGLSFPDEPAFEAGLREGDRIVSINGQPVNTWNDISVIIDQSKSDTISLVYERGNQQKTLQIQTRIEEGRKIIGISPQVYNRRVNIGVAIWEGVKYTWALIGLIVKGFWDMITFQTPAEVGGPVLIAKMVGDAAEVGWEYLIRFTALLSINLGIINLFPFPALDGGRILFLGIELVRGKAVDPEKEGFVHFIGFVVLMALIALIIYKDIARIF